MKISFGKRPLRGGLKESLKEAEKISKKEFEALLPNYEYYCFDERVKQFVFVSKQMKKDFYTYIFIQIEGRE